MGAIAASLIQLLPDVLGGILIPYYQTKSYVRLVVNELIDLYRVIDYYYIYPNEKLRLNLLFGVSGSGSLGAERRSRR